MSQPAGQPLDALLARDAPRPATATPRGRASGASAIAILFAGAIVTATAASLAASAIGRLEPPGTGIETSIGMAQVPLADLGPAIASLDPTTGRQAAADARACRIPLAVVSLSSIGPAGDLVRVRSGAYLSPPIRLGPAPQRVAIPFPAPYGGGRGVLAVEGAARGVNVALQPVWPVAMLDGSVAHAVTWIPGKPC